MPTASTIPVPAPSSPQSASEIKTSKKNRAAVTVLGILTLLAIIIGAVVWKIQRNREEERRIPHLAAAPAVVPNRAFDGVVEVMPNQVQYAIPMEVAAGADPADYLVPVGRNPEYHYAPPLNPPRWEEGEGGGNLEYADADAPADRAGNTRGGPPPRDAEGYVVDDTAPPVVYASYVSSTEAGVGTYEMVAGHGAAPFVGNASLDDADGYRIDASNPLGEGAVTGTVDTSVCTAAEVEGRQRPSTKKTCTRSAPTGGTCSNKALPGGSGLFCKSHTCPECGAGKSSSEFGCPAHLSRPRKQSVYAGFEEDDTEA
jgi:hypothetical protein